MPNNIIFGTITVLASLFCYYMSWRKIKDGNNRASLGWIMIASLLLKIFTSADFFLHEWDERYHALVAKNMMEHPFKPMLYKNPVMPYDYTMWTGNHIWLHKQPLPLWIISISFKIFGVNEIALRLPSIIASILLIFLIFKIASSLFNKQIGYICALFISFDWSIISHATGVEATDHYDLFFVFFITLSIYCCVKYISNKKNIYHFAGAISMGLAILCKWLPGMIVLPVYFLLLYDSRGYSFIQILKKIFSFIIVSVFVFLPWQLYIFNQFPLEAGWESSYNKRHLFEELESHGNPLLYYFINMLRGFGELVYIPVLWFIYNFFTHKINYKFAAILAWFILPYLFFTVAKTKMPAYTMCAAPAVFLMIAYFIQNILIERPFNNKLKYLLIASFFILPFIHTLEVVKPFENRDRSPAWIAQVKLINKIKKVKPLIVFNSPKDRNIETMFYADCTSYSTIPPDSTIKRLKAEGYDIYIIPNK